MNHENTIRILLGRAAKGLDPLTAEEWRRVAARCAWVEEMIDKWSEAQRAMDERCTEAVERLSGEEFERFCDQEQAKVDAILAQIEAVKKHDRWPKHLYFGGI